MKVTTTTTVTRRASLVPGRRVDGRFLGPWEWEREDGEVRSLPHYFGDGEAEEESISARLMTWWRER